jgi:ribonuclease P protein component
MALASIYRIHKPEDFEKIKKEGTLFQSESFGVSVLNRNDDEKPRFGYVISTKISKMAVHRNRIRRALEESLRQNLQIIPAGLDFVFLVKKTMMSKTVEEMMTEVKTFLTRSEYNDK